MNARTWLPHTRKAGGYRIFQIVGGRRWSLAVYVKPKVWVWSRCDACNRRRRVRFSPPHGALFCRRHYRENNR